MPEPTSKKPGFSFTLTGDHLRGRLRVDAIQDAAVLDMAAEWRETDTDGTTGDTAVINAVDLLADAMQGDPTVEERDALVEAVQSAASMQDASVEFDLATALRLRQELDGVIRQLARFGGTVALPGQRGAA